jgi:hypothetical protein
MLYFIYFLFQLACPWQIYSISYTVLSYVYSPHRFWRLFFPPRPPRRIQRDPPNYIFVPHALFSVSIFDAVVYPSSMVLSAIRIPIQWNRPQIQHTLKDRKRVRIHRRPLSLKRLLWLPLLLFSFASVPRVYAIPGTNHALIPGGSSLDRHQQHNYVDTMVNSAVAANSDPDEPIALDGIASAPDSKLKNLPYCFVADTDSVAYVLDTGANRLIINNAKLFAKFTASNGRVKGIGGDPVQILGTGSVRIPLKSDDGKVDYVSFDDAVYVPTSPYNLLPPQILHLNMKAQGYDVDDSRHNESRYLFTYKKSAETNNKPRSLTVPVGPNLLFTMRSNEGYLSFFRRAEHFDPDWTAFAGASHVIPDDESADLPLLSTRATMPKQREPDDAYDGFDSSPPPLVQTQSNEKQRESDRSDPDVIPFDETDFEQLKDNPIDAEFTLDGSDERHDDVATIIYKRKQQRLMTIHERLGHISFARLRNLAKAHLIPHELASVDFPTCPGCAYGKAHRLQKRYKGPKNLKKLRSATSPGSVVSVDQLVSPTPGFVPTHRGIPTTKRYTGATVFVDHFSDFTYTHLMVGQPTGETTVEAKLAFERVAASHGVPIRHYHSDNGLFDSKVFKTAIEKANQTLSFCGPNAHHQNGKAENRIKDITTGGRTQLLHASHRWPKAIDASLWPAALKNYTNLRNSMPTRFVAGVKIGRRKTIDRYDQSPLSRFSGTVVEANLDHFHPFGSPVYILEGKLQAQQSYNKWMDRSKVGIFLCHSPDHASNVPLVLNTQTGNVLPQFHCLYDNEFASCRRDAKFQSLWQRKAKFQSKKLDDVDRFDSSNTNSNPLPTIPVTDLPTISRLPRSIAPWDEELTHSDPDQPEVADVLDDDAVEVPLETPAVEPPVPVPTVTTRSGRTIRIPVRLITAIAFFTSTFSPLPVDGTVLQLLQPDVEAYAEPHPFALFSEHVVAFVGSTDPDTMTLQEALKEPDRDEFIKAMTKELTDHVDRKHWKVVPRKSIPAHKLPIPMVWSMKRKRNPVGDIVKWKARLCAGGHKSLPFIDYWSTYSPVISWNTVRVMVVMALLNGWHMRSIDFVLAFPQAPVKTDIYMNPPRVPNGFNIPDLPTLSDRLSNVYKLLRNLYGLKDAGKTWFEFLRKGLLKRGWEQSEVDICLFTKAGILLVVYVDDAILISPHASQIQDEIRSLQVDYALTDDGDLKDYLGTRFERNNDGSITLSQPKMIERVLKIVGLDPSCDRTKLHDTPASEHKLLDNDPDGKPRKQPWNYRSAVGCLSYLQAMIRPDITMAVQQCARFCNNPQQEHEEAVKRICRYLMKTKAQGLTIKPDKSRGLECFVDADWAGSWQHRSCHDPLSAHSRTGYVIMYAGCPIIWASKMQPLIALSTTEAEYIALSTALREVIAVMHLMQELRRKQFTVFHPTPKITCRTFEDNQSCIEIATNHKTRPRTKHLSVRLHHFRSFVISKAVTIEHISTKEQIADMFTKPLARVQFCKLRNRLMCWSLSPSRGSERIVKATASRAYLVHDVPRARVVTTDG